MAARKAKGGAKGRAKADGFSTPFTSLSAAKTGARKALGGKAKTGSARVRVQKPYGVVRVTISVTKKGGKNSYSVSGTSDGS